VASGPPYRVNINARMSHTFRLALSALEAGSSSKSL
jgi:hypothetical protein